MADKSWKVAEGRGTREAQGRGNLKRKDWRNALLGRAMQKSSWRGRSQRAEGSNLTAAQTIITEVQTGFLKAAIGARPPQQTPSVGDALLLAREEDADEYDRILLYDLLKACVHTHRAILTAEMDRPHNSVLPHARTQWQVQKFLKIVRNRRCTRQEIAAAHSFVVHRFSKRAPSCLLPNFCMCGIDFSNFGRRKRGKFSQKL